MYQEAPPRQVKSLCEADRLRFARLVVALNLDDRERVVRCFTAMGHRTRHNRPDTLYTMAKLMYDSNDGAVTRGKHIQHLLDDLQRTDPVEAPGQEFVLVARVCVLLRGLGFVLHQPRSTSQAWLPIARSLLVAHGEWDPADDARLEAAAEKRVNAKAA